MIFLEKMEKDLFKHIKCIFPKIATQEMRSVFTQIGSALKYIHSKNITHCDIKPENIGVSGDLAVLMDFEYASEISEFNKFSKINETWKNRSVLHQSP
jgi:serine/threonine protein kinase